MVDDLTVGVIVNVYPIGLGALLARQAGDILLDERTDNVLVKRADEVERVAAGIGCKLLGHLQSAVIVELLDHLGGKGLTAPVVATKGQAQRVAECSLGNEIPVLEHHVELTYQVVELLLVLADVGEHQVVELEQGLQILDG